MKIPFSTYAKTFLFAGLLVLQYQNCSSYNDPSPFEISSNLLGAAASSPGDIRLDGPVGTVDMQVDDEALIFSGECNIGLSTKHYIEIKMHDATIAAENRSGWVPVRMDSMCPANTLNLPDDCYRAIQFRCEHGRYNVVIPVSCSAYRGAAKSTLSVLGELVTVDANGNEVRDKAKFDRQININWRYDNGRSVDCP
jgi:hypothetical protein